jgi:hypothetical protein
MKCLYAALSCLVIATAPSAPAQTGAPPVAAEPPAPAPRIVCDGPQYDFGERDESESVKHDFVIRNAGTSPLVIAAVHASCGCTATSLSTNTVPPGGETKIQAVLSLRGRRGMQTKTITVESNDPVTPRLTLLLKGVSATELGIEPSYLSFGPVPAKSETYRDVRLVSRRPGVAVTNVTSDTPFFAARPKGTNGWGAAFTVHTVPPLETGDIRGNLTVFTDHPSNAPMRLPLIAVVEGEVRVIPKAIVLQGPEGTRANRTIMLMPGTVKEYRVLQVDLPADDAQCEILNPSPGTYRLNIANLLVAPEMQGKTIRIHTDLQQMKDIFVKLQVVPQ